MLLLLTWTRAQGEDWPQFLGPTRNGIYAGVELGALPKSGPATAWKIDVGHGFSGAVVARGRVILFHRRDNRALVESLDAGTGKRVWVAEYPTDYRDDFGFDDGPRATPAIAGERIYTFGAEGVLQSLDFSTGKRIWSVDTKQKFGADKGFFGAACSPLVEDGRVLLNVGGPHGAGIVAFDAATGRVLWTATNDEAGYSAPVATTIGGARHALFLTRSGLVDIDPATGKIRFQFP
ncbi:MAG: PQQ-like beta-propeller repeat protein [Acidobacteriia bacterium]|nr:PQQ-like beta-propeller repeat protein [Terriglobia bacterium]